MELTKEHFDHIVAGLATKDSVTRAVADSEKRVIQRIDDAQEELARIIADTIANPFTKRFDRLEELLEVKEDVQTLKHQMSEIRSALHFGA